MIWDPEGFTAERLALGLLIGAGLASVPLAFEVLAQAWSWQRVGGGAAGMTIGIAAGGIVIWSLDTVWAGEAARVGSIGVLVAFGYLGWRIGTTTWPQWARPVHAPGAGASLTGRKLLDTSVIIDGRIADLCETGFLDGVFVVPQFILHELQHIADSSDSLKRVRGRRGLDILHRIRKMPDLTVTIVEEDFPHIRDVDAKLVALAKKVDAKIVTNDLNLNKVAELQGVRVLNINDLTNALRPTVLPGEGMRVSVLREGKEAGQGVGYLDDGTMIVIDEAKKFIGRHVEVIVTSVLQTTAGRMIFTRLRDESERAEPGTPAAGSRSASP
ncbi:MAG: PIN domain-containing protein [Nitrospiria bacterium]